MKWRAFGVACVAVIVVCVAILWVGIGQDDTSVVIEDRRNPVIMYRVMGGPDIEAAVVYRNRLGYLEHATVILPWESVVFPVRAGTVAFCQATMVTYERGTVTITLIVDGAVTAQAENSGRFADASVTWHLRY